MTYDTSLTCPRCGGRLCVDVQYPYRLYCDTCEYEYEYDCNKHGTANDNSTAASAH